MNKNPIAPNKTGVALMIFKTESLCFEAESIKCACSTHEDLQAMEWPRSAAHSQQMPLLHALQVPTASLSLCVKHLMREFPSASNSLCVNCL